MMVRSRLTGGPSQHRACVRQQADLQHNGVPRQHGMGLPRLLIQASPAAHPSLRLLGARASSPQAITGGQTSWGRLGLPCVVWALFLQLEPDLGCTELPTTSGLLLPPPMLWGGVEEGTGSGGLHPQPYFFFFSIYLSLSWLHWVLAGGVQDLRFLTRDFLCGGPRLSSCGA